MSAAQVERKPSQTKRQLVLTAVAMAMAIVVFEARCVALAKAQASAAFVFTMIGGLCVAAACFCNRRRPNPAAWLLLTVTPLMFAGILAAPAIQPDGISLVFLYFPVTHIAKCQRPPENFHTLELFYAAGLGAAIIGGFLAWWI